MRKTISFSLLIALFLVTTAAHAAKKPDWVNNFGDSQQYPTNKYIVGFGSSEGADSDAFQAAQDDARADVSRTIVVDIKGLLRTVKEEDDEKFSQHLSSITQSSTAIQLMGLKLETYGDDKPPTAYALAYVDKADLRRIYSKRKSDLQNEIRKIHADAQAAERRSMSMEAATKYLSLYPLYEALKEAETILLVVGESIKIENAFAALDSELGEGSPDMREEPLMGWTEIANKIDELLSQDLNTVDDVARSVVIQLSKQAGDLNGRILTNPFTYQDTKMSSPFARYFKTALENQIGLMANLKWDSVSQTKDFKPRSTQIMSDLAKASGAQWMLSGTYWDQGDKIKLMANLRDVDTGKILAGADILFAAKVLEASHLSAKPGNYQQAHIEQEAFNQGEVVSGQLQVNVWTNKGNENLIFTEGEDIRFYVRVNRPAYVRLVYILSDGRRTMLYNSLYVDQSKVNRVVEIPEEFECARPFGAEMLVAIARTEDFPPAETVEEDGFYFLKADSPAAAAAQARAIIRKRKKEKKEDRDIQQSEAKIVITTMRK